MFDRLMPADRDRTPQPGEHGCEHSQIGRWSSDDGLLHLWSCHDCRRRFYPACPECVDVAHRGERHPEDEAARATVPDAAGLARLIEEIERVRSGYMIAAPGGDIEQMLAELAMFGRGLRGAAPSAAREPTHAWADGERLRNGCNCDGCRGADAGDREPPADSPKCRNCGHPQADHGDGKAPQWERACMFSCTCPGFTPREQVHVHEWQYSVQDAVRWCDCGAEEATPGETDVDLPLIPDDACHVCFHAGHPDGPCEARDFGGPDDEWVRCGCDEDTATIDLMGSEWRERKRAPTARQTGNCSNCGAPYANHTECGEFG